jgi:hypothetical protein
MSFRLESGFGEHEIERARACTEESRYGNEESSERAGGAGEEKAGSEFHGRAGQGSEHRGA